MRVLINQKVKKEVIEPREMELVERYVLKLWQGNTKIAEVNFKHEPSDQEIAEVLYQFRYKDCEATVGRKIKLVDAVSWDELDENNR